MERDALPNSFNMEVDVLTLSVVLPPEAGGLDFLSLFSGWKARGLQLKST